MGAPAIWEHRMLGDGHSTALLRPNGEVDWWCAPRPDSSPLLWRLLDSQGASARWCSARPRSCADDVAGPALLTLVEIDGRPVELFDGLVTDGDTVALVRLGRAVDRPVTAIHHLQLGGFDGPRAHWDVTGAIVGDQRIVVSGDGTHAIGAGGPDGAGLRSTVTFEAGCWRGLTVAVGDGDLPPPGELADRLQAARRRVREDSKSCRLPDHHPELARRALAVVDACTFAPTGALVASPTTSLPEAPGGDRQFDYRFTWLRDSALAVSVAALLGRTDVAERYLRFLLDLGPERVLEAPLFDVTGGDVPAEREVPGVAGWEGSRPIRVGNAAADQLQYDVLGTVIDAAATHVDAGGRLGRPLWRLVRHLADRALADPDAPSNGIWELRAADWLVSADIGRWLALDRAAVLARRHRVRWWRRRRRWSRAATATRARVLGALRSDGGLPQTYGDGHHDASSLLAVLFGMLDRDDPRATALVDATLAALGDGPFLRRYDLGVDDGFSRCEAAFLPCSWWAVGALALTGRLEEARARVAAMLAVIGPLQSEEADAEGGRGLGNVPLVWSHVEAARAMLLLDDAATVAAPVNGEGRGNHPRRTRRWTPSPC